LKLHNDGNGEKKRVVEERGGDGNIRKKRGRGKAEIR
jgi:hypothetical protein